jgi:hypothetical protein
LATEGKNKTETHYFRSIPNSDYVIQFAPGNYTDPVNMMRALKNEYNELGLDTQLGDVAFCLLDSDVDPVKNTQLERADALSEGNIKVIVSSPCFEIWYLCHYSSSTRQYGSSNEVIKALRLYIPEYRKEMAGIWRIIGNKTEAAIHNAKILEQKCLESGKTWHTVDFSPSTEVYKIIELLIR